MLTRQRARVIEQALARLAGIATVAALCVRVAPAQAPVRLAALAQGAPFDVKANYVKREV